MNIETVAVQDLQQDPNNARKHDTKNLDAIAYSLKTFGQRKPIVVSQDNVVIAGNGTLTAAKQLGWTEITIARVPADWTKDQIKAYALADNRSAELAEWDKDVLANQVFELKVEGWDTEQLGFWENYDNEDAETTTANDIGDEDNTYTAKVNLPQYQITGEKPAVTELFDTTHKQTLLTSINNAELPDDIKDFLREAANRHTRFNYHKIAEFYAHQPKEIQELFEQSALVIIDIEDAIKLGYARFMDTVAKLRKEND